MSAELLLHGGSGGNGNSTREPFCENDFRGVDLLSKKISNYKETRNRATVINK
jgi:hypothetical protein